ncbi:Dynein heavy chain, partial [Globisporangium splendens]
MIASDQHSTQTQIALTSDDDVTCACGVTIMCFTQYLRTHNALPQGGNRSLHCRKQATALGTESLREIVHTLPHTRTVLRNSGVSGYIFKAAQLNWSTVEKEAYPIMTACTNLEYMLQRARGFRLYCDHANLIPIFAPQSELKKHIRAKLQRWAMRLTGYIYTIEHIPGEHNLWADIVSRWGRSSDSQSAPKKLLAKDINAAQKQHQRHLKLQHEAVDGTITTNDKPWIPPVDKDLLNRLLIVAHCGAQGNIRNEVLHWDFLYLSESYGPQKYVLVLKDGLTHHCELVACSAPTAAVAAEAMMDWHKRYGAPAVWVSDNGSHFKNDVLRELSSKLKAKQVFVPAYSPWINGTVERLNRDILQVVRVLLLEFKLDTKEWPFLLPVAQFNLNHTQVQSLGDKAPVELFTGLPCSSAFDVVWKPSDKRQELFGNMTKSAISKVLNALRRSMFELRKHVVDIKERTRLQQIANKNGVVCNFVEGDFVLWSRADARLEGNKLTVRWLGPFRVVRARSHSFLIENLITKATNDVHGSRLKMYADSSLNVNEEMIQHVSTQGIVLGVQAFKQHRYTEQLKRWELMVAWQGLEHVEDSWEALNDFHKGIPSKVQLYTASSDSQALKQAVDWLQRTFAHVVAEARFATNTTNNGKNNVEQIDDDGPMGELEYWRRRMQRLTSITEQLKMNEYKDVFTVLSRTTESVSDDTKQRIQTLLRRWKQIDIGITEAANEAKDNVKYLFTLEKFIIPLYNGTPSSIIDTLPELMNSIKMIHSIARYYNTTERMANLFTKITNQMITNCKHCVTGGETYEVMWDKDPEELVRHLDSCLKLNEAYQQQYRVTKDKLFATPKGKQFEFNEMKIFGKFDLFCRRVTKLVDMFTTIHQFSSLGQHKLEGMEDLIAKFNSIIREFQHRNHDLLDYKNNRFDRDYVEFNVRISDLEGLLQKFINDSFENITSIEHSLNLLRKFQTILQRENLKSDLDSKFNVIFQNYGLEPEHVLQQYEKYKQNPPYPRNLPPVAGNIAWSRHLLKRIEEPMKKFESNQNVLASKDAKRIIRMYNKVARTLVAFECIWYQACVQYIDTAKAGLQATLIIRHPEDNKLHVNFDPEILQLLREAKCLDRMGIEIPEAAKIVLLQEEKFENYYNELQYALSEYDRIVTEVIPVTAMLLRPHFNDMEFKLRPGMITLTWTSMNIEAYRSHIHTGLQHLEELVTNINDIIENRIEKNMRIVSKTMLVDLPVDQSLSLEEFVAMQGSNIKRAGTLLQGKNIEIENAVEDLLKIIMQYPLDSHIEGVSNEVAMKLKKRYNHFMYQALLHCTKNSLSTIKKRVASRVSSNIFTIERPFFEVDVQLSVPRVVLHPSLDDIQLAINKAAKTVLSCSKELLDWGQNDSGSGSGTTLGGSTGISGAKITFFGRIAKDIEIVRVVLLLAGSVQGLRNNATEYLGSFQKYEWLWMENKDAAYDSFQKKNPELQDFEKKLKSFVEIDEEITGLPPVYNIGVLSLNTRNIKLQLKHENSQWKLKFSDNLHNQAHRKMESLTEYFRSTMGKLNRKVIDLDSLRFVMNLLKEVRARGSGISMEINPVLDMYEMLEYYLPDGFMEKEEMDQKSVLQSNWRKLIHHAEARTDELSKTQAGFKRGLLRDIKEFIVDVKHFREDYMANGPMVIGIPPVEAVERLNRYKEEYEIRERKFELYASGEELFALPKTTYPELETTKKELQLQDKLFGLHTDVLSTIEEWKQIPWLSVAERVQAMTEKVDAFSSRCKKMPAKLREWEAYTDLKQMIDDFTDILPLLQGLSKESIKPRHWDAVMEKTGTQLDVTAADFKLQALMDANIVGFKAEIEEITDGADKQLKIEVQLGEISQRWETEEFQFQDWKSRNVPILKAVVPIVEELEETQMNLQTMLSMRHVAPFRDVAQQKLEQLSDTSETLERWIKVQMLWCSLESVFTGGDIAKQMPVEAKKFQKIDKDWAEIMTKYVEIKNVVRWCASELLKSCLPPIYSELEKCQKSLEGYLEQKRNKFPRFYFVSNPVFDSIERVYHDKKDKTLIHTMMSGVEEVRFSQIVKAQGNIEDWLATLLRNMQITMKDICRQSAIDIGVVGNDLKRLRSKQNRIKIETLVTIHVHQRDVMTDLVTLYKQKKISDPNDFEWLKQARFYWRPGNSDEFNADGACVISITDVDFNYQCECLGSKERLVVAPLTDRCYITLAQALGMYFGGAPAGPAGTGKTETVKDLGRTLGIYVVVTNCTDQQKYTDCAKIFKGLCQGGLWGCFDEFNRIQLPVLSVVAQQVLAIQNAKKTGTKFFQFPGDPQNILLSPVCGFFITMNPGYAGRQELPENLKALFRGVAMMVPDFEIIMKVKLCSVGYSDYQDLAKKFFILYNTCKEQLSAQKHYDWGLRNILAVLRSAGKIKRDNRNDSEAKLLYQTLRDMNLSKLVAQDVPLFLSLLADLFPTVQFPPKGSYPELQLALQAEIEKAGLVDHPGWFNKVIQLYETQLVRHGIMLVGPTGGGKTKTFDMLMQALMVTTSINHKQSKLNPKAIRAAEMYGEVDPMSGEWTTGVFAAMWSKFNSKANKFITWMVCDGPVDAIWIEDLNTVLDDNKILTLANGDRMPMTENVKLMFEVETLVNASPATVSRAGIVFISDTDLDWAPVVEAWIRKRPVAHQQILRDLFMKYMGENSPINPGHCFDYLNRNRNGVMSVSRVGQASRLFNLLTGLLLGEHGLNLSEDPAKLAIQFEKLYLYCIC